MIPPKCRICGMREHNHRCQGGTPAQRIEEQQRLKQLGRRGYDVSEELGRATPVAPEATAPAISSSRDDEGSPPGPKPRRRWHDDTDSAGEPVEVADYIRKPARFYAPPGQCTFCDRRRAAARVSMRAVRERGEA